MNDYPNLEFHRQGYGMLADLNDKDPGAPICFPRTEGGRILTGRCNCRESKENKGCVHFSALVKLAGEIKKERHGRTAGEIFAESRWYRLGALLSEGDPVPCSSAQTQQIPRDSGFIHAFVLQSGTLLARFLDASASSIRFLERIGRTPSQGILNRFDLLSKLAGHLRTKEEQLLNDAGSLTRRQAAEQSFWGRLAYHAFREFGDAVQFHPIIERERGDFLLQCFHEKSSPILELAIPRMRVRKVLALLAAEFPKQADLAVHPIPLKSIFRVTQKTKLDIEVRPMIQALQASGEAQFFERIDFAKFRYGDLVFIPEMNVLAELENAFSTRRFAAPVSMHLQKSQLPSFLDENRQDLDGGNLILDDSLRSLTIHREFDRMEISLDELKRSWYWLSIRYGFGDETVSLADILKARQEGKSYLETGSGWIDLYCDTFRTLDSLAKQDQTSNSKESSQKLSLSAAHLLRLMASFEKPVHITGEEGRAKILKQLMALAPAKPWNKAKGLSTELRPYQWKGVDWLRFLFENQLGGLLCDDMGLGKTHQAMALMAWLKEKQKIKDPFLVVCPTTVISHWLNKLRDHAPGLSAVPYHGGNRKLEDLEGNVILTSYGVLRNDILTLKEIPFSLAIFDEIQNLKNQDTQSYQAASIIQAQMRIGLTGTPIENSLKELKSLFDIVLPGYLGSDAEYASRFLATETSAESAPALAQLKRTIAPFTLRRLKIDVLEELPEKIEDVRTCQLSDMQVKLYREAISSKGAKLLSQMRSDPKQFPYIHIFALLNLLKMICDHPALALNKVEDYGSYTSGKWDLFQELLLETLDNGQKLVVFTQYLGMITMMERLLADLGVPFVTLTGASQDRGSIIHRFNEDADCRVFLGSLKAGGTGIDLVGGSTVLHYDRWWNAAREDQATDRVHRIGQKRAVQVFKLVTEGTLEEKISAIIERKRRLMNAVVQADNPQLSKIFSRDELLELLQPV
jgi:superfamily II DNA or RNA helicase